MIQYIDPDTFPPYNSPSKGQNPSLRGYPVQWQKPHWHGDNVVNPHMRVLLNEPDGTRQYYDPVTGTYSFEHSSGYHHAVLQDGAIENVPGKKITFVGGGGLVQTVSGQTDVTRGGHYRENNQGDTYTNTKGVSHTFSGQGSVTVNMGNSTEENYGSKKIRIIGEQGAYGVGVGSGDGNHDNAVTITNNRICIRAHTNGDVWINTANKNINISSGAQANITSQTSTNMYSGTNFTIQTGSNDVNIISGGNTNIKPEGGFVNVIGNLNITGILYVNTTLPALPANSPPQIGPTETPTS